MKAYGEGRGGGSGKSPPGGRRVTGWDPFLTPEGEREVLVPHSEWPASLSLWITARNQWDHFSLTTKTEAQAPFCVSSLSPKLRQGKGIPFHGLICHWRSQPVSTCSLFLSTHSLGWLCSGARS